MGAKKGQNYNSTAGHCYKSGQEAKSQRYSQVFSKNCEINLF